VRKPPSLRCSSERPDLGSALGGPERAGFATALQHPSRDQWQRKTGIGLGQLSNLSLQVPYPNSMAASPRGFGAFKELLRADSGATTAASTATGPIPQRLDWIAQLLRAWGELPPDAAGAEKVALVLANYPKPQTVGWPMWVGARHPRPARPFDC